MKRDDKKNILDSVFLRKTAYSYVENNDADLSSYLCFALAKNKDDLILHQQRIELCARLKKTDLLFSSLIDLFITLKSKGLLLKERNLKRYQALLNKDQVNVLEQHLQSGLSATSQIKELKESLLCLGLMGDVLSFNHYKSIPETR